MKIKRENNKFDSVDVSFRYAFLLEQNAKQLCDLLDEKAFEYEYYSPSKRSEFYVIVINIEKYFDEKYINEINKKLKITSEEFGFWFGINSEYDTGGISIPHKIVDYIKVIGGKIDFSYMIFLNS